MKNSGAYVSICLAAIVAYLLSLPLAVKLLMFFPGFGNPEMMLTTLYAPVIFLLHHSEAYAVVIFWEFQMLGIPIGD